MEIVTEEDNGQPQAKQRQLTPDDPVSREGLESMRQLVEARMDVADRLLSMEQDKIALLAAAKRLDEQRQRLFEGILMERGIDPRTQVELDSSTGRIKVFFPPQSTQKTAPDDEEISEAIKRA
jgi:hypothetical protein